MKNNNYLQQNLYFNEIRNDILKINLLNDIKSQCNTPLLELIENNYIKIDDLYFNSFTNEFKVILESNKIHNSNTINYFENNISNTLNKCLSQYVEFKK